MFNERMEAEAQLRSPQQQVQQPPSPKKSRAQTAGQSPKKRSGGGATTTSVTTTTVTGGVKTVQTSGPISKSYEARGLTEIQVENEHLRTVDMEVKRERTVTQSVQEDNAMLREQLGTANERIRGLEKVRKEQAENITQLEKVRDEQATHISQLEQVRDQQKSHIDLLVQENAQLKAENEALLTDKDELQREVQSATDYILQLEEKCFTANKTALELLTRIRDHESEVETLRAYIVELRTRIAVYIPVKADAVDKTLSEYINNYPDRRKLKLMFLRMQEGVYEFGTRRVHIKVERNHLLVKIGGGWLQIDEFLDQYIPAELEKYEKIDPLNLWRDSVANAPIKQSADRSPVRRQNSPLKK